MKRLYITLTFALCVACTLSAQKTTTKKDIKGSLMYSCFFPWDLDEMYIEKGTWDGFEHTNYKLYHGVDYVCQRFVDGDTPSFTYCNDDDLLKAGAYIIQFADNYAGQNITMKFTSNCDPADSTSIKQNAYYVTGDASGRLRNHKSPIYKFVVDDQRFEYFPDGKIIGAYEAYIVATTANPQQYIAPNGSTGIEILQAGILSRRQQPSRQGIYDLSGRQIRSSNLTPGLYIINGKKQYVK